MIPRRPQTDLTSALAKPPAVALLGPRIPAETLLRLWMMLAHQPGNLLNAAALTRALAVDGKTIAAYLDLVEAMPLLALCEELSAA